MNIEMKGQRQEIFQLSLKYSQNRLLAPLRHAAMSVFGRRQGESGHNSDIVKPNEPIRTIIANPEVESCL
jgi:hypothetical protein